MRSKRNAWWRDVMLAYFAFLSDGRQTFSLPTGSGPGILVRSSPVFFTSPYRLEFDSDFVDLSDDPIDENDEDDELDEDELVEGDETKNGDES